MPGAPSSILAHSNLLCISLIRERLHHRRIVWGPLGALHFQKRKRLSFGRLSCLRQIIRDVFEPRVCKPKVGWALVGMDQHGDDFRNLEEHYRHYSHYRQLPRHAFDKILNPRCFQAKPTLNCCITGITERFSSVEPYMKYRLPLLPRKALPSTEVSGRSIFFFLVNVSEGLGPPFLRTK